MATNEGLGQNQFGRENARGTGMICDLESCCIEKPHYHRDTPDGEEVVMTTPSPKAITPEERARRLVCNHYSGIRYELLDGNQKTLCLEIAELIKQAMEEARTEAYIIGSANGFTEGILNFRNR